VGAATFKNTATIVASYFAPTATATIATGTIFAVMHRRHVRPVHDLNARTKSEACTSTYSTNRARCLTSTRRTTSSS
jgi:hypothetical protein